jgi:hypothetical protein
MWSYKAEMTAREIQDTSLLTLLTSSTRNEYKIHLYRDDTRNAKVYLIMMLSVYQMLPSYKLKDEF